MYTLMVPDRRSGELRDMERLDEEWWGWNFLKVGKFADETMGTHTSHKRGFVSFWMTRIPWRSVWTHLEWMNCWLLLSSFNHVTAYVHFNALLSWLNRTFSVWLMWTNDLATKSRYFRGWSTRYKIVMNNVCTYRFIYIYIYIFIYSSWNDIPI